MISNRNLHSFTSRLLLRWHWDEFSLKVGLNVFQGRLYLRQVLIWDAWGKRSDIFLQAPRVTVNYCGRKEGVAAEMMEVLLLSFCYYLNRKIQRKKDKIWNHQESLSKSHVPKLAHLLESKPSVQILLGTHSKQSKLGFADVIFWWW